MQVQLYGINKDDIQLIFEDVIKKYRTVPKYIYVDCSYLYNFHLDDFEYVRKFNLLCRYDLKAVLEWHQMLERWLCGESCIIGGQRIKPIQISRSFDRVVNELMEDVAGYIIGGGKGLPYKYHAIGDGTISEILPNDKFLVNELSRIDVTDDPQGGTLARDGSTVYIIGNHPKSTAQGDMTEEGAFNSASNTNDKMLDHSQFPTPIQHLLNQDVPGGTIAIWQCGS